VNQQNDIVNQAIAALLQRTKPMNQLVTVLFQQTTIENQAVAGMNQQTKPTNQLVAGCLFSAMEI